MNITAPSKLSSRQVLAYVNEDGLEISDCPYECEVGSCCHHFCPGCGMESDTLFCSDACRNVRRPVVGMDWLRPAERRESDTRIANLGTFIAQGVA